MAVTHTDRVGTPLEQSYVILRDAERVELDIGALGLEPMTSRLEKGGAAGWL